MALPDDAIHRYITQAVKATSDLLPSLEFHSDRPADNFKLIVGPASFPDKVRKKRAYALTVVFVTEDESEVFEAEKRIREVLPT